MSNEQITQETVPVDQATTEAQPQATQTTVATADTPAPQSSWKESISEAYRNDPSIEKFTEHIFYCSTLDTILNPILYG